MKTRARLLEIQASSSISAAKGARCAGGYGEINSLVVNPVESPRWRRQSSAPRGAESCVDLPQNILDFRPGVLWINESSPARW